MTETFKCEVCEQTFTKIRSDEEAMKEYAQIWGEPMGEELGMTCAECNKEFMEWLKTCNVHN